MGDDAVIETVLPSDPYGVPLIDDGANDELVAAERAVQKRKLEGMRLTVMRAEAEIERAVAVAKRRQEMLQQQQRERAARVKRVNEEQFDALRNNDKDELIRLLEGGADVNYAGKFQRTPMHECVMLDNSKLLQVLLRYRGNPEAEDIYVQTPFSLAIKYNRERCFELMTTSSKGAGRHMYQRNLKRDVAQHTVDVEQRKIKIAEEKQRVMMAAAAKKSRLERAKMLGYQTDADGNRI
jgi:hypothetical protein